MVKMFLLSALLSFWLVSQRQVADWLTLCVYAHASNLFANSMKSFHLAPDCIYKKKKCHLLFSSYPHYIHTAVKEHASRGGKQCLVAL